ncbi:hypothetical protein NX059_010040 [Plenodomus lindquistii]|nr:hypothetical protein NX059_010040 [Plenodomus lindquistii]
MVNESDQDPDVDKDQISEAIQMHRELRVAFTRFLNLSSDPITALLEVIPVMKQLYAMAPRYELNSELDVERRKGLQIWDHWESLVKKPTTCSSTTPAHCTNDSHK